MNKPIFCIVGRSGVGKSTYLDALMNDSRISIIGIKELKYHTTRSKRSESEDTYNFVSYDEYLKEDKENIIEERHYKKFDEDVVYYTTKNDIENNRASAFFCAASVDQALSYYDKLDSVYIINIEVDIKERLQRLINRCNTDNECYEVCRRALEENNEYEKLFTRNFNHRIITIDNSDVYGIDSSKVIASNVNKIVEFIYGQSY